MDLENSAADCIPAGGIDLGRWDKHYDLEQGHRYSVVSVRQVQKIQKIPLVIRLTLRIARIIGPILTALLTMLKASLLRGSIGIHSVRRPIASLAVAILRSWRLVPLMAIRLLAVTLRLVVVLTLSRIARRRRRRCVVRRMLVVGIRHN